MGYVSISIDYRTGWKKSLPEIEKGAITLYRSIQDLSSALFYLENEISNENKWQIDTSKLFINGNSSGAITALNYHFINAPNATVFSKYEQKLGAWKTPNFSAKGILNLCGAISDTGLIEKTTPILSIHGNKDNVINFKTAVVNYSIPLVISFPKVELQGSYWIQKRSKNLGANSSLYQFKGQKHSPFEKRLAPKTYADAMDTTLNLIIDFLHKQTSNKQPGFSKNYLDTKHLSKCYVDFKSSKWRFYPVDKNIKKLRLIIKNEQGKTIRRKRVKKKLKAFGYSSNLKNGTYLIHLKYGNFKHSETVRID